MLIKESNKQGCYRYVAKQDKSLKGQLFAKSAQEN